jgi:YbbR domain-containing protein
VSTGRRVRRIAGRIVHNWPLKLAAVVLATVLYAGLVASQDSATYPGPITVASINQPAGTVITNQLRDVEEIRYIAPADLGRLRADDFRATVDLANVKPDGNPASVRVNVTAVDPRVTILEVRPRSIQVVLDQSASKTVKVSVVQGTPPPGLEVGETTVEPAVVTVSGPSGAVNRVAAVRVNAPIDGSGLDVDRDFRPEPLDAAGSVVTGVDLEPATVHVTIPVYTNKETRTIPVNPIVTGTPGAGFRIAAVTVVPTVVTLQGDGEQLSKLVSADTAPVSVSGATRDITADVALALPSGVTAIGSGTARVKVTIEPVTETRTFVAGVRLVGMQPGFDYAASDSSVQLTLFGSTADLDTLASAPIVVAVSVADLAPGAHKVPIVPSLPSGVTVAAITPPTVTVTVTEQPTPSPEPSAAPTSQPSAGPSPSAAP